LATQKRGREKNADQICDIEITEKGTVIVKNIKKNSFVRKNTEKALKESIVELFDLS